MTQPIEMALPIDANNPISVEILCLTSDGPIMFEWRARRGESEDAIEIDLNGPAGSSVTGSQAILTFPQTTDAPRVTAKVLSASGNHLSLTRPRVRPRDKRLYPRLFGNIPLRFRVHDPADGDLAVHRWLAGSTQGLVPRPWYAPEPFMNFSVNGLSFESPVGCDENALLLLHMGVGESPERWHATGRVVRVREIPAEEGDPSFQIAVSFEALSDEAMESLSNFTLSIQEALL